jgi:glutathione S-transferase
MKLYHHPFSPNARKAVMLTKLLDVPVELVFVDLQKGEQRMPEHLARNPNGAVPVLVDGDLVLPESHAILMHLCETAGDTPLYPRDPATRANLHRWLFWQSSHWAPSIAGLNFENNLKKMFGAGDPTPAIVERYERFFKQYAAVLDSQVATRKWVLGDTMTIADLAIAAPLMYIHPAKLPMDGFDNVLAWFARVEALDAWKQTDPFAARSA